MFMQIDKNSRYNCSVENSLGGDSAVIKLHGNILLTENNLWDYAR